MFYEKNKNKSCTLPKDKQPMQVKDNIYLHMHTTGIFQHASFTTWDQARIKPAPCLMQSIIKATAMES